MSRYILEPYKGMHTRYRCPSCQQRDKTFSLYIDSETNEHLHPTVGRCNRESNCGYHYTPKQYFQDNPVISGNTPQPQTHKPRPVTTQLKPVSFIPVNVFKASLQRNETNNFIKFLIDLFGVEVAGQLVSRYFIATSKHWNGATVFWQIDTYGKIRTGKIMLYNPSTGKRVKEPFNHISWVHSALKQPEFNLGQCLFGEHLLIDNTKPVAIVESEKTAIIASIYLPQFIWLAVGSLTNLNAEKCSVLKGRSVTLFPDLNGFEKWSSKAKELSHLASFQVSDLLERKATEAERKQGFDLADYLIKFDYKLFLQSIISTGKIKTTLRPEILTNPNIYKGQADNEDCKPTNWQQDITELENYFAGITPPTQSLKLNTCSTITNCSLFIESHFDIVRVNKGKRSFLPYLHRLQELRQVLNH